MKIPDLQNREQRIGKRTGPAPGQYTDSTFQQLLESKLSSPATGTEALQKQQTIAPTNIDPSTRIESLHLTEQIVQLLEDYEGALKNRTISVSEMEPFIVSLEEKTAALVDLKSQIDPRDPLAKLLGQISSVAYLETIKYRRGDYNA